MMDFVYFSEKEDFYLYLEEKFNEVKVITPSPSKADSFRLRFHHKASFDVITISKFTASLLEKVSANSVVNNLKRKAEIVLIFGILRSKYFPHLNFESFWECYEIFSDLRSFSLNSEITNQVIEELPSESQKVILLFDQLIKNLEILDEHAAYSYIAQFIKENQQVKFEDNSIVIWGFSHLNGQQIDLIKALSLRNKVLIPIPIHLKEKIKKGDWISWLKDSSTQEIHLEFKPLIPKAQKIKINSREIAKNLNSILKPGDQVLIGVSKLEDHHLFLLPSSDMNFKIQVEILDQDILSIKSTILNQLSEKKMTVSELGVFLTSLKELDYKQIKSVALFKKAISSILELTDGPIEVDEFLVKLLTAVVKLNQPRLFYTPLADKKLSLDLKDFSSIDSVDHLRRTIICVDDRFGSLTNLSKSSYSDSLLNLLSSIGPVKRPDLDLDFKIWDLHSLMTSSDVIVLMTEESIKYDLSWKRIFQKVDFQANENLMINNLEKNSIDYFEKITNLKFEGVLSSTRIQSFIDCPRKFYFSHIKKISPRYEHSTFVTPLLLGEITHAVIEKYFILDSKNDLSVITDEILVKTLELKSIKLEEKIRDEIFYTVFHRAKNGVEVLSSIGKVLNEQIGWNLEFPFDFKDDFHIKGKIDCCAIVDDTVILIDFKSSAVPSLMEIETFQNIQIWMYLDAILKTNSHRKFESVLLGFISLDNPETSKFLSTNSDLVEAFKGSSLFGVKFIKEPFDELAQRSKDYLMNTCKNIFEETHFRPKPRKESICLFCDLSISCSKGRSI
jgi:hypothetical protein